MDFPELKSFPISLSCFLATNMKWVNKKVTVLNFSGFVDDIFRYLGSLIRSLGGGRQSISEDDIGED